MFKDIKDLEYETYKPVDYLFCKDCGLIAQSPLPDIQTLPKFYPDEYRNYLPVKKSFFSALKNIQFQNLANKITKYSDHSKDKKILEIGFGNGQLLTALKQKGYENLYGSDFTDKTFANLEGKGIELKISNIEEGFPFDEKFDFVIMNNVIEHFLNPVKVLENCKKNLTNNGKIILITPNSGALEFSIFKNYWAGFHAPRHTFLFNSKNIKIIGEKLGFKDIKIESISDPGQWSISIQNILQDNKITKIKLKNGMAWYLTPLALTLSPIVIFQNFINRSTSMMCVLTKSQHITQW